LGLSKELTSLVWMAGPISGLVCQPIVGPCKHHVVRVIQLLTQYLPNKGSFSDSSPSKYRRRAFIAGSTTIIIVSMLCVAHATAIAAFVDDIFGGGQGDWDPKRGEQVWILGYGLNEFVADSSFLLDPQNIAGHCGAILLPP
jgi:solute carrier family 45 protein 1/2/4